MSNTYEPDDNQPEPEMDAETLGPCGCTDYHVSDCPTRTGYADMMLRDEYGDDDYYAEYY